MIKELLVKNYKVILTGLMSGVLSFSMLTFINFMIGVALSTDRTSLNYVHIALFIGILLGFVWARRSLSFQLIRLSQNLFWQLRMRVIKMILRSNYSEFASRKDEIHSVLVHDINVLTNASLSVIEFIISSVVILSCLVYMGILSWPLFLITLSTSGVGVFIYQLGMRKNNRRFQKTRDLENGFMKYFGNILNGFKEIAISPFKGNDIFDRKITPIAKDAFGNNTGAFVSFLNNQITGQVLFYALIGSILLIFSVKLDIEVLVVINFLFILLYVLGALETIMVLLPGLLQARVSLNRIKKIEEEFIGKLGTEYIKPQVPPTPVKLVKIEVNNLYFCYENSDNEQVFEVGPINVDFERGELVFIYGGNGSGKTTLIMSLLGLLKPNSGHILLNGEVVPDVTRQQYRQLFSVVFNDFHLFDEFYGNLQFDQEKARKYLELFEIESKVTITQSGFSRTNLSTGQRKRLALIEAILENREIIVLDEWAADQDPYFRKKFYETILPMLKQEGITVLLITHDDKYYNCCDKLLKMEYGKLIDESSTLNYNQA